VLIGSVAWQALLFPLGAGLWSAQGGGNMGRVIYSLHERFFLSVVELICCLEQTHESTQQQYNEVVIRTLPGVDACTDTCECGTTFGASASSSG